ncbi:DUF1246 domain-containing protein, partial [Patescibacteria group bacterium]|nr:DUF1246 domain-containing protein [Patescibacteria group bacterium]
MDTAQLLKGYDLKDITVGVLGGHSALDVCHGAKQVGFKTVCVARKGREKTYTKYFKTRTSNSGRQASDVEKLGCIDEVIVTESFQNILDKKIQEQLRSL